ncbi:hypothetical protein F5051DRAFT_144738 [Lentinula edodes]|nr:hypothetical protein F5051DRAFT_144738 [Lentinula edodes]
MYQRSYSRGSSGINRYLRIALYLLLATLVGVCIASPIPSGDETDDAGTNHSSDISSTAYGSFNPSQIPHLNHWIDRRSLKDKLKSKLPWGKKVGEEDEEKKPVDEGEVVVLGYTYHQSKMKTIIWLILNCILHLKSRQEWARKRSRD